MTHFQSPSVCESFHSLAKARSTDWTIVEVQKCINAGEMHAWFAASVVGAVLGSLTCAGSESPGHLSTTGSNLICTPF
jgi:hypothetical protein